MTIVSVFLSEHGTTILQAIITALAGYLGIAVKGLYTRHINDSTKKAVARTCVEAVEQLFKDLHGKEKFNKAVEAATDMLTEKGISTTSIELQMLIEAAVSEFNQAFQPVPDTSVNAVGFDVDMDPE